MSKKNKNNKYLVTLLWGDRDEDFLSEEHISLELASESNNKDKFTSKIF